MGLNEETYCYGMDITSENKVIAVGELRNDNLNIGFGPFQSALIIKFGSEISDIECAVIWNSWN